MDEQKPTMSFPKPAIYFPPANGRYEVRPGLSRLGTDFGNGAADTRLFQFDTRFPEFRANKLACRAERFGKYVCTDDFTLDVLQAVTRLFTERLIAEYPDLFTWDGTMLSCAATGETLRFDTGDVSAFDALCCQVPEDIAIMRRSKERGDWIAALHLCAPSAWAAEEKIGLNWDDTHAPVPGMEKIRTASRGLVAAMIERPPTVRFTWGIQFTDRLNDHPEPPPGISLEEWKPDASIADAAEPFYLRAERQTIWRLPEVDAALFAIRIYHTPFSEIRRSATHCAALLSALRSMSPESRTYKSLNRSFGRVCELLGESQ